MKMNGDSHVVAMVDADRPEAIPGRQCSEGEGEYRTRPYTNVYTVERVLRETTEGAGGHEARPYEMKVTT